MSQTTETRQVKARKRHRCDWCGQHIEVGEIHPVYTAFFEGTATRIRMHAECRKAMDAVTAKEGWIEWMPGDYTRGCTCEHGDPGHGTYSECLIKPVATAEQCVQVSMVEGANV
jgi:hypothetical protein